MTPLQIQIPLGWHDERLLVHIDRLEGMKHGFGGNARLSDGEKLTLQMCWDRLELVTRPESSGVYVDTRPESLSR